MARKLIETTVSADAITFTIENVPGALTLPIAELSNEIHNRALVHGLIQKISDAAAMPKSELSGDPVADAHTKSAAMQAVISRLLSGDWSARNGDGSGPVAGIIYRAFERWVLENAAAKKVEAPTPADIRAAYDKRDRAGQLALKAIPRIAAIMDELRAEKPAKSNAVDGDALLSELGL